MIAVEVQQSLVLTSQQQSVVLTSQQQSVLTQLETIERTLLKQAVPLEQVVMT